MIQARVKIHYVFRFSYTVVGVVRGMGTYRLDRVGPPPLASYRSPIGIRHHDYGSKSSDFSLR